jgi:hypothetical protein
MPLLQPTATYYGGDVANDNYYLRKGQAIPSGQPLVAPVSIKSPNLSKTAAINVDNTDGFISLSTGENTNNEGPPRLGLVLNSGANGVVASIGDSTIESTPALLLEGMISGVSITSEVFDQTFNPPTGVELINLIGPNVTNNYPNGWLLNDPSGQVVTSFQGGPGQSFSVPKSGLYMLQASILMAPATTSTGGTDAGGFSLQITVNNANSPFPSVGGVVIGQPTPLSSSGPQRSYYSWNSYIPLASGVLYALTVQMLDGVGVTLPPNLINNLPYSDLKIQLIKIG